MTELKSSGKKRQFASGALRDDATGKPRMELLPMDLLTDVAQWYTLGAVKYGDNNWRLGQPVSACVGSLLRHLAKWLCGHRDEDHLSAIIFNTLSIMNVVKYHSHDPQLNDMNYQKQIKKEEDT
ncbi:MAG: hypothetical protein CVU94_00680 [Firmicutes bacterium HGW-Firmicutes-19]|nr:MAG: hypothetical protein CVU94_00680 [Firmicutes bacterium HGW-Firmicutes-19]